MFQLTDKIIDENELKRLVMDERAGAIVTFDGRVRNHNEGKAVSALAYEAYDELAINEGEKIIKEAMARFAIVNVAAAHRTGDLAISDVAVFVAVSSAHREDAFKACRFVIDEIKSRLPIWKREAYEDGSSVWVNCQTCGAHSDREAPHKVHHSERSERSEHAVKSQTA
ncbi:MAG: molybdenum cofactor biosynthesis protein MoaE [Candidatus Melainabacteria bacterium]|mgnify:CR=1 FL=1|nr:molybdenum cofactor biosynthesis protein MoaE [Candidatus Melainabacteria bacterium]